MGEKAKLPRSDGKLILREEGRIKVGRLGRTTNFDELPRTIDLTPFAVTKLKWPTVLELWWLEVKLGFNLKYSKLGNWWQRNKEISRKKLKIKEIKYNIPAMQKVLLDVFIWIQEIL